MMMQTGLYQLPVHAGQVANLPLIVNRPFVEISTADYQSAKDFESALQKL
jgi:hypothetical protein